MKKQKMKKNFKKMRKMKIKIKNVKKEIKIKFN